MDKPRKWMNGAIKDKSHPLDRAAARHGVSHLQEAEKESHSSDPSIRGRGLLGKRLIQGHGKP